jgi:hypothetical protein
MFESPNVVASIIFNHALRWSDNFVSTELLRVGLALLVYLLGPSRKTREDILRFRPSVVASQGEAKS